MKLDQAVVADRDIIREADIDGGRDVVELIIGNFIVPAAGIFFICITPVGRLFLSGP